MGRRAGLNRYALIAILAVFYVILGTALDGISMIVLTAAVVLPMIQTAGFDLVWFGVFIVLLVEIAEVTPPVGFNLFVLQNMTGKDSNTIARAAFPFFAMLIVAIALDHDLSRHRDLAARSGNGRAAVMRIVVIGAGIIGVTTAYFLRRDGHDVTVIERRSGVAQETSFANAGVMAPSYVAPWSQPGMPAKVLAYLFKAEAPIVFRPSLDPALWRWIARWLGECRLERFTRNKARMQRLAFYSQSELRALRELHQLDYEQTIGYLQLFRTHVEVERSAVTRKMLTELGVAHRLLSTDEAHALEPALHAPTRARRRASLAER